MKEHSILTRLTIYTNPRIFPSKNRFGLKMTMPLVLELCVAFLIAIVC